MQAEQEEEYQDPDADIHYVPEESLQNEAEEPRPQKKEKERTDLVAFQAKPKIPRTPPFNYQQQQ